MSLLATTILPALLPALGDAIRGGVARLTGGTGAQPQNVDEYIRVQEADIKRLQALAELDRPAGNISLWVANLRASARYLATFAVILNAIVLSFVPGVVSDSVLVLSWDLASGGFFYLFGDRAYFHLKRTA